MIFKEEKVRVIGRLKQRKEGKKGRVCVLFVVWQDAPQQCERKE